MLAVLHHLATGICKTLQRVTICSFKQMVAISNHLDTHGFLEHTQTASSRSKNFYTDILFMFAHQLAALNHYATTIVGAF